MNLNAISKLSEDEARAYLEGLRWPDGPACVHCGDTSVYLMGGKATRPGLYKCRGCRKQFTVTVGTIFHRSHVPLRTWLMAFALVCGAKKGLSAKQLQRALGLGSYKTAWHLAHRIRHVMRGEPIKRLLAGVVECDETFVGGRPRFRNTRKRGRGSPKAPVVTLVERGGDVRAAHVERVTAKTLRAHIHANADRSARLMTDELRLYRTIGRTFDGGHGRVNHSANQYAKDDAHVNTAESFHSLIKRGVYGSFHHVSPKHLHRYVDEFAWKWNHRKETDAERTEAALRLVEGRRLTYAQPALA